MYMSSNINTLVMLPVVGNKSCENKHNVWCKCQVAGYKHVIFTRP